MQAAAWRAGRRAGAGGCIDFTLEIGYPKTEKPKNRKPKAESRKPKAESRKPKAEKRIADSG
ncbi:putative phosphoserine phosphatase [Burkholderia pseudomallei 668]|nr:putative phosphoserine phosphatase [Burkholderia pseudomallei 668]